MTLRAGKKFQMLASRKRRPQPQISKPQFLPPLQGGVNAIAGAANIPPTDALRMVNMIPQHYGSTVRHGYKEWCLPVPAGTGIRTIIPYTAKTTSVDTSKLFVCTNDGIYNASTAGALPVKVLDWPSKTAYSGWCSWHAYQTIAGQFMLVADLENGYYVYNGITNTWAAGSVSGTGAPATTAFDFVTVWKNRVWLIQRDKATAWYFTDVGTFLGPIKPFEFGNKFRYGGHLKGIFNWTLDGGEGIDDHLVAVSTTGDVLIYKGTDPESATDFNLSGSFWIGHCPMGRRVADDFGGDIMILTAYGLIQLSKIVGSRDAFDPTAQISYKINPRITTVMERTRHLFGWEVKLYPKQQLIFVLSPKEYGMPNLQFVYNTATQAWCTFNGVPALTVETWSDRLYIGAEDNRLYTYEGHVDRVLLTDAGASATAIEWEQFSSFQSYGAPAIFKRVQMLRPQFVGDLVPAYFIAPRYDFDLSQLPGAPSYVAELGSLWDGGLWNNARWGGDYIVNQPPIGGSGVGRHIAIQLRGRSSGATIHVGTDVMYDVGGML